MRNPGIKEVHFTSPVALTMATKQSGGGASNLQNIPGAESEAPVKWQKKGDKGKGKGKGKTGRFDKRYGYLHSQ